MQEIAHKEKWSNRFDQIDQDLELKRMLNNLETENSLLKRLVVKLSATIIKNVAGGR
jgi:hypothetical protein